MTNYRIAFFKSSKKRIDMPFGFITELKFNLKNLEVVCYLKYSQIWKFYINDSAEFKNFNTLSQLYLISDDIRSSFAYNYALKSPEKNIKLDYDHDKEYARIGLDHFKKF